VNACPRGRPCRPPQDDSFDCYTRIAANSASTPAAVSIKPRRERCPGVDGITIGPARSVARNRSRATCHVGREVMTVATVPRDVRRQRLSVTANGVSLGQIRRGHVLPNRARGAREHWHAPRVGACERDCRRLAGNSCAYSAASSWRLRHTAVRVGDGVAVPAGPAAERVADGATTNAPTATNIVARPSRWLRPLWRTRQGIAHPTVEV
jgi:hypothetical protein